MRQNASFGKTQGRLFQFYAVKKQSYASALIFRSLFVYAFP
jgi:hypothetical protein